MSEGPLGLVPTPSLIPSDGVNMHGPKWTSARVLNGLGTCGAPTPWTTSNQPHRWSAHGALFRLTSRPGKMFTFAAHPPCPRSL